MKEKYGSVEIEIDETGKIVGLEKDGKPLKKMYLRGLKKAQETKIWNLFDDGQEASNPFSGVTKMLNGFEYSIYNWCISWYRLYERNLAPTPIQTFDDMKYLLLEINPDAYFDLLD